MIFAIPQDQTKGGRMATVVCMDGLGGLPEMTFGGLRHSLSSYGHKIVLCRTEGIERHEQRVIRVLEAITSTLNRGDTFLLGQSAGGGAVRRAAEILCRKKDDFGIKGLILLSQSMPRYRLYMTPYLLRNMLQRMYHLVCAKDISPTEKEYARVVEPLSEELRPLMIKYRQMIPGKEARELAFNAPKLGIYHVPLLVIYGEKDRWISPRAHANLGQKLVERAPSVRLVEVPGSGHLTLASDCRAQVILEIKNWIESQSV